MKIGITADTHSKKLPAQMIADFKSVDKIFLVGDVCDLRTLGQLKKIKEVEAVYGNMDDAYVREALPRKKIIPCGKFHIGLFHGEGPPFTLLDKVIKEFKEDKVDAVVFGHSHHPMNKVIKGVLYFNPGSPTDTIFAPYQSYGILEVNDKITGKVIKVDRGDG